MNPLYNKHIISASQFDTKSINCLFNMAANFKDIIKNENYGIYGDNYGIYGDRLDLSTICKTKMVAVVFYEPSTRTSSSFIAASQFLGASVIPITQGIEFSSVVKGETLEDTIRTLGSYSDLIVLRHPDNNAAEIAAGVSNVPIINAGSGSGEHPSQALLDLFTILEYKNANDTLNVTMVGDLKYGRTVHSLIKLMIKYGLKFNLSLVAPRALQLPENICNELSENNIHHIFHEELNNTLISDSDVFYITRIQKERFVTTEELLDTLVICRDNRNAYNLTTETLHEMKQDAIIMHPFPRVNEIHSDVDKDTRAVYFEQMKNGLCVRMALLHSVLKR